MSNEEVMQQVPKGYRLTIPENAPPQLSEIMRKSWDYSPNQRPTFQVKKKEYLSEKELTIKIFQLRTFYQF